MSITGTLLINAYHFPNELNSSMNIRAQWILEDESHFKKKTNPFNTIFNSYLLKTISLDSFLNKKQNKNIHPGSSWS